MIVAAGLRYTDILTKSPSPAWRARGDGLSTRPTATVTEGRPVSQPPTRCSCAPLRPHPTKQRALLTAVGTEHERGPPRARFEQLRYPPSPHNFSGTTFSTRGRKDIGPATELRSQAPLGSPPPLTSVPCPHPSRPSVPLRRRVDPGAPVALVSGGRTEVLYVMCAGAFWGGTNLTVGVGVGVCGYVLLPRVPDSGSHLRHVERRCHGAARLCPSPADS